MIVIVAYSYEQAHFFCRQIADPPINPHDPQVVIFSTSSSDVAQKSRGRRFKKGDRLIFYGKSYEGRYNGFVEEILFPSFLGAEVSRDEIAEYVH